MDFGAMRDHRDVGVLIRTNSPDLGQTEPLLNFRHVHAWRSGDLIGNAFAALYNRKPESEAHGEEWIWELLEESS
jgi:hypothetical protein